MLLIVLRPMWVSPSPNLLFIDRIADIIIISTEDHVLYRPCALHIWTIIMYNTIQPVSLSG